MSSAEMPIDALSAKNSVQTHSSLFPILTAAPIEEFERDILSIQERLCGEKNGMRNQYQQNGSNCAKNPDLIAVIPHLIQLLKTLVKIRNEVLCDWENRKTELDQYSQLKLFEQDAENLSQWICKHFNNLTHRFVLIGENEVETNRLLKEHLDFAESVNKIEVSYTQVLTIGNRLLQIQPFGLNKIEDISKQLKSDWNKFLTRIGQRTQLLMLASSAYKKCNLFLKNVDYWKTNVGEDPNKISLNDLPIAAKKHLEFQKIYKTSWIEANEELQNLAKFLKKYFGESLNQLPIASIIQEKFNLIGNSFKGINSVWEARDMTIKNKLSSAEFITDLNSVLDWLNQHGEPFLNRKTGIGVDPESASILTQNHQKFRAVAINTFKNADQIFRVKHVLDDADVSVRNEAIKKVDELHYKIEKFKRCTEHRTHLLHLAYYFYLHYNEIMDWYEKMDSRANYVCIVPESVENCEKNKETFQKDNDLTVQAYDRVMIEAQQLLQSLNLQSEYLEIDNSESVNHVQQLTKDIENRHLLEKERWKEQRIYLNTAFKISTFLRDCFEIKKQLESWRQDLQGLKQTDSNTVEKIKHYHTQNTVKVQYVVSDAMKQLDEILELIQSKNLRMVYASDTNIPVQETLISAARQLQNLEQDVMNIAKDISNRIELSIHLNKLRQLSIEIIDSIERQQLRYHQYYNNIPGNEQETNLATKYFNEFRLEIELIEEKISTFYNEKERFTSLPLLALDYHAETRVQAENLLTDVKAKWQGLVGLIDIRYKTLTSANSYYKYTKLLLPTSQSIEKDLLADNEGDFCKLGDWTSLEHCQEAMSERLEKHKSHKERFLQASVYAQKTADQFIKCMRSCKAPREHVDMRIFEVQKYKETIRERQTIILCLWKECNAKIEKCKLCVKIKISAKNIIDWSDRELATCVLVIENVEKAKKVDVSTRRKMLDDLLNKCLEEKDLMKVERYHLRTMLKEAKEFLEAFPSDFHSFEVDKYSSLAKTKLQNIWSMLTKSEQTIKNELNLLNGKNLIELDKNECCLDRYSDSTIEDKLTKKEEEPNKKINEPMKELLKSEADYIEDLRRCIEIYLFSYKTAGSMCPLSIRGKEKEIFGNIEEIYQFHSKIFLSELHTYEQNPEDVGYCFIAWMEKLKELYADYCLNNEANAYLIGLPEAKEMFREVREQNNLELCHELQSLVIKPVQRVAKYHVLLNEIFKHSTKNTKEIKNAYEIVLSIPKLANDRMHLKNFEDYQKYNVGDFVMQDTFLVSEPKRYFKREREFQIFLFESNIIFTKREELNSKKIGYVFKDSMLLRELHVVEHIEADNTKFGLRKSAFPYQNDQNTTVLKANTEAQRILWVKTLRDLKMDIGRHKSGGGGGGNNSDNSNRASRDSQSSLILQSVVTTTALAQLPLEDGYCSLQSVDSFNTFSSNGNVILRQIKNEENQQQQQQYCEFEQLEFEEKQTTTTYIATEDFIASKPDQLNILTGQKVEILANNEEEEEENEFIKIAILDKFGNRVVEGGNEGFVPKRILMQIVEGGQPIASTSNFNDDAATTSSNNNKRTSIRRFFTSSSQKGESKCQQQQRSSPSGAILRPKSSSTTIDQNLTINNNNNKNNNKILSPSTKIKQQQKGEEEEEETCLNNNNNDLLDLPPPMDQLGEKGGEVKENGQLENESSPPIENNNNTTESSAIPETSNSTAPPQMNAEETCRLKRSYVLQELVETERAYVVDLTSIVDGYIATLKEMELSDEDREKVKIIFANIEQILDFHKSVFCKEIEKCLEDYEAAGNAFIKYERRLHTFYVKYCQNKPKSDFLVSQDNFEQLLLDVKDRLGHKVSINDLLIKPVQRITKYQLMLSDILKYTHRANDRAEILERAHDVMRVVPKACDDMMQVGRLQGFQGNLTAQGRLIFQGTLIISDGNINQPFKGKERRVFLFEQSVIIAECIPPRKEYGNPLYNFKNQIMVNKMVLEENFIDEPLRFVLQSNDPNQPATFVAQSSSMEDKEQWLNKLSAQLDQQKTFLAALVDPKRYLANSMGSMNISGKKDSSGSLGTPTSPGVNSIGGGIPSSGSNTSGAISPTKPKATQQKSSGSKLFGFGKQKT